MTAFVGLYPSPSLRHVHLSLVSGGLPLDTLEIEDLDFDRLCDRILSVLSRLGVDQSRVFVAPAGAGRMLLDALGRRGFAANQSQEVPPALGIDPDALLGAWREELARGRD